MKKRMTALGLCLTLLLSIPFALFGCRKAQAADLMEGIEPKAIPNTKDLSEDNRRTVADFAVRLFQNSIAEGKNTLISPVSVLYALSMTANGAKGETLAQMEAVLGMPVDALNDCLLAYMQALPNGEDYKLSLANSIWIRDDNRLTVEQDFLQKNADYYGAGVYKAAFDKTTLKDINNWVKAHTDGMIEDMLDEIPGDAVMYLVNALAFDAKWQDMYEKYQVHDGVFTTQDGKKRDVELMYSEERRYLKDENATGFVKYYKGGKYAFAALLPNEGVSVSDYAASLTGERLTNILSNSSYIKVNAAIPRFESEYSVELSKALIKMGMPNAFDNAVADFTGLGTSEAGNISIGRVLHKTFIAVNEQGTRAGAATIVEMNDAGCAEIDEEVKTVYLDRPFVYLLIDCETNLPVFIGTLMDAGK